jgi:hypothetical protein
VNCNQTATKTPAGILTVTANQNSCGRFDCDRKLQLKAGQPPSATWRFDRDHKLQSKAVQPPSATDSAVQQLQSKALKPPSATDLAMQPTLIKSSATTHCNRLKLQPKAVQPTQTATESNCNQNSWHFDRDCIKLQPKLLALRS